MKLILAAVASLVLAAPAFAAPSGHGDPIPPNCILDPWTHEMHCVIWPTCTLDPWTGKMTCPVPQPRATLRAE